MTPVAGATRAVASCTRAAERVLASLARDGWTLFGVILTHERLGDTQHAPARRRIRRAEDHADAILLGARSRRLREELRNLDTQRAREAHQCLE